VTSETYSIGKQLHAAKLLDSVDLFLFLLRRLTSDAISLERDEVAYMRALLDEINAGEITPVSLNGSLQEANELEILTARGIAKLEFSNDDSVGLVISILFRVFVTTLKSEGSKLQEILWTDLLDSELLPMLLR